MFLLAHVYEQLPDDKNRINSTLLLDDNMDLMTSQKKIKTIFILNGNTCSFASILSVLCASCGNYRFLAIYIFKRPVIISSLNFCRVKCLSRELLCYTKSFIIIITSTIIITIPVTIFRLHHNHDEIVMNMPLCPYLSAVREFVGVFECVYLFL